MREIKSFAGFNTIFDNLTVTYFLDLPVDIRGSYFH